MQPEAILFMSVMHYCILCRGVRAYKKRRRWCCMYARLGYFCYGDSAILHRSKSAFIFIFPFFSNLVPFLFFFYIFYTALFILPDSHISLPGSIKVRRYHAVRAKLHISLGTSEDLNIFLHTLYAIKIQFSPYRCMIVINCRMLFDWITIVILFSFDKIKIWT